MRYVQTLSDQQYQEFKQMIAEDKEKRKEILRKAVKEAEYELILDIRKDILTTAAETDFQVLRLLHNSFRIAGSHNLPVSEPWDLQCWFKIEVDPRVQEIVEDAYRALLPERKGGLGDYFSREEVDRHSVKPPMLTLTWEDSRAYKQFKAAFDALKNYILLNQKR